MLSAGACYGQSPPAPPFLGLLESSTWECCQRRGPPNVGTTFRLHRGKGLAWWASGSFAQRSTCRACLQGIEPPLQGLWKELLGPTQTWRGGGVTGRASALPVPCAVQSQDPARPRSSPGLVHDVFSVLATWRCSLVGNSTAAKRESEAVEVGSCLGSFLPACVTCALWKRLFLLL